MNSDSGLVDADRALASGGLLAGWGGGVSSGISSGRNSDTAQMKEYMQGQDGEGGNTESSKCFRSSFAAAGILQLPKGQREQ